MSKERFKEIALNCLGVIALIAIFVVALFVSVFIVGVAVGLAGNTATCVFNSIVS